MRFRQLFPEPGHVEIEDYVRSLNLRGRAPAERPYTVANFVASLDGRASVRGRSGRLGDDGDKAVFRTLRRNADAVLVGTGTLEAERYGRLISDPEVRAQRRAEGLAEEPLACTLTRTGRLPLEIPLFSEAAARVVVFTGAEIDVGAIKAQVEVVHLEPDELDFAHVLARLRTEHRVEALLCEGGPSVLSALLREQVLDELFLTLAPKLLGGGDETPVTAGPELAELAEAHLAGALERHSTLFLRYERINQV